MVKRTKQVKNADISDVETWLKALEDGKFSDFNVRDPYLLRAIGIAQREHDDAAGRVDTIELKKLEWKLVYAISVALHNGETWYGVARTLGVSAAEAKDRYLEQILDIDAERLKAEREQIAEEQEVDAREREDDEADTEDQDYGAGVEDYPDVFNTSYEDLSENDKEAVGRLADAVAAFVTVDKTQIREGGLITVTNKYHARYEDRVLRVAMNVDGQLEAVLLAGPPNLLIKFSDSADWQVDAYEPPVYKSRQVGWATVVTEENVTKRLFGMWVKVQFSHEERLHFVASENGRYYDPRDIRGFDESPVIHPGPMNSFHVAGAEWLYEFGNIAQGVSEEARSPWERISGKKFYLDRMAELIELLKDKLS